MRVVSTPAAAAAAMVFIIFTGSTPMHAQDHGAHAMHAAGDSMHAHDMFTRSLGGGWRLLGMAQLIPTLTTTFGDGANDAATVTELVATQPVVMFNVESRSSRIALRTTLNLEGITLRDGEVTFGGWGEGFIDRRHPHTLLHEAMLSVNLWAAGSGSLSLSAGKGFAPYGTDDPMARPVAKYPTNHHLSQILERFTANVVYRYREWSLEAGVFGGTEPTGPYDFSNIESFGNSWSGRIARRFGGTGTGAPWELSASYGHVVEEHGDEESTTRLINTAIRHDAAYPVGRIYALVEASVSDPDGEDGFFSVLGEAQLQRGRHTPYARVEVSTRPEYEREGGIGSDDYFRYDHDDHPTGATRWVITTLGYGFDATSLPFSVRPFVEVQHANVALDRGAVSATDLFGTGNLFGLTVGARIFFGGGPMRMGAYGVLDAMTEHGAPPPPAPDAMHH